MTSMSYCMMENSSLEMAQVVNYMIEADSWEDMDFNQYEESAKSHLYDLCKKFIKHYDRLEENVEEFELET
jgi:hypothetical protein